MRGKWHCSQRGDCCRTLGRITMSPEEAQLLRARAGERVLLFEHREDGFVTLLGSPACPFYDHGCTVYDVRPYNCRRFMCFRERDEPFNPVAIENAIILIRDLRRQYDRNQRAAQPWADAHGWKDQA